MASGAVDAVRSAIPTGFIFKEFKWIKSFENISKFNILKI
jgi:hypothetical protein